MSDTLILCVAFLLGGVIAWMMASAAYWLVDDRKTFDRGFLALMAGVAIFMAIWVPSWFCVAVLLKNI